MKKFIVHYIKSEKKTKKDLKDEMLGFDLNGAAEMIKRFVADHIMTAEDITATMRSLGHYYSKVLYADENDYDYWLFVKEYKEEVPV